VSVLVDTHVFLWWFAENPRLSLKIRRLLDSASADEPVLLCDISLWEIANLHSRGRIELDRPLREWLEMATAGPRIAVQGITAAVAATVAGLPSTFHRDPADRIIVATAMVLGAELATLDRRIKGSRLVPVIP
jgi:PIN domain nuclease of toxin-antitoxin system